MEDEFVMPEFKHIATMIPARYTEVLENLLRYPDTAEAIATAMSKYPLYETDPNKVNKYGTAYKVPTRQELNTKILSYYRFREIGQETVGRWLFELETALNEIMPRYNQLFYSADQDFNPIFNVDYNKVMLRDKSNNDKGTSNASTSDSTNGKSVNSQTPHNQLHISSANIDSVDYADEADWNATQGNSTSQGTTTNSGQENESIVENTKGNFGVVSAQDLILKYRETIINIEQMIIHDPRIEELFMLIYQYKELNMGCGGKKKKKK